MVKSCLNWVIVTSALSLGGMHWTVPELPCSNTYSIAVAIDNAAKITIVNTDRVRLASGELNINMVLEPRVSRNTNGF